MTQHGISREMHLREEESGKTIKNGEIIRGGHGDRPRRPRGLAEAAAPLRPVPGPSGQGRPQSSR